MRAASVPLCGTRDAAFEGGAGARKAVPRPARGAALVTALQIRCGGNFGVRAASVPLCGTRDAAFEGG
ncbi:MAG: hypothetical protein PHG71_10295, partial [Kiritimatiellae bacterium]|nr:hypothetical protein [Kiritimatiellia bacterium]